MKHSEASEKEACNSEPALERARVEYPPQDGGIRAWLFLIGLLSWKLLLGAFLTAMVCFGSTFTPMSPSKALRSFPQVACWSDGVSSPSLSRHDFDFLRKPLFLMFLAATIIQALAHYGPSVYLPSIGADFGLTPTQGALLVSLVNLSQAIGQPLQGMLADSRASLYVPFIISTLGGGLESLLIWPFARNLWSLVIYSLIFGVFTAARGMAIFTSAFVTEALVHEDLRDISGYGAGPKWRDLMVYTGVSMTVASLGAFGKFVRYDWKIGATKPEAT
ncbi:hypothetical protein McanMca71_003127 [Microsporum canis]|uniref:Major facilitator superfamily (MFS) profile domain-containing protein n=1 Tax=Arthroderma otae (strain ATCC MYA-4605 / CBS 113480) TaxID=554155 RepID=C5G006_ARTOC|nr:uncharacterized protein MCYG_08278 [Microsporum canis CBS 113480]EEQ35459.1 predicted protein [Microsporum canis CBS 113480]